MTIPNFLFEKIKNAWNILMAFDQKIKRKTWLRIAINLFLLLFLFVFVSGYVSSDWNQLKDAISEIKWISLIKSFAIFGVNVAIFIFIWHSMMKKFGSNAPLLQDILFYSYGQLAKLLPTPAWYIASRLYLYNSAGITKRKILTVTLLETILHSTVGLAFYSIVSIQSSNPTSYLFLAGTIPAFLFAIKPNLLEARWFIKEPLSSNITRNQVLVWMAFFLLSWIFAGPFLIYIIESFNIQNVIPINSAWRIWTISSIIAYVGSYTLGGIGVLREFSLTMFLKEFYNPSLALLITIMSRIVITFSNIVWSLFIIAIIKFYHLVNPSYLKLE